MKRRTFLTGAAIAALLVAGLPQAALASSPGDVTVFPLPSSTKPANPDQGWTLIDYALPASTADNRISEGPYWQRITSFEQTMPDVANVAIVSTWDQLEPQDGVFDWTLLDQTIAYWKSVGKHIQFRISTEPYTYSKVDGAGNYLWDYHGGAPDWLRSTTDANGQPANIGYTLRSVDADYYYDLGDPVYQQKLTTFVNALANRYRADPEITQVDLRGYGQWGEWHSGYAGFGSLAAREAALADVIDIWDAAWGPNKILALSNSYEFRTDLNPDVHAPSSYSDYLQWSAFDHALTKPNIAIRRDGVAGAVRPYDRQLLQSAWQTRTSLPITTEFWRGYSEYNTPGGYNRSYTPDTALDDALSYHPNYITMMGWDADSSAGDFYTQRHDLIQRGIDEMGYNLVLGSAAYPRAVAAGSVFSLDQNWRNTSAGRLFRSDQLAVSLTDTVGNTIWTGIDTGFDPRTITRESPQHVVSSFALPASVPAGTYDVRIAVVNPTTHAPAIALGIQGGDELRRYRIGSISVTSSASPVAARPFLRTDFDNQSWQGGWLTPDAGATFVTGAAALSGTASLQASTTQSGYTEFLRTDRQSLRLRPNTTYTLSFAYKAGSAATELYTLGRSLEGGNGADVGTTSWTLPAGSSGTKTVTVTTGAHSDYRIIWGIHGTGTITIDDIGIVAPAPSAPTTPSGWETFEAGSLAASAYAAASPSATYTTASTETVNGAGSVKGTSTAAGYTEFLYSKAASISLLPLNHYTVTFDYRALAPGTLYSLSRTPIGTNTADRGYTEWSLAAGDAGTKTISFSTADFSDYFLIWGLKNGGSISIDDIRIVNDYVNTEDFESGAFASSSYTDGYNHYGTISSAAGDVVNGSYSAVGSNNGSIPWYEFAYSNPSKIRLQGGHTYKVTVAYRQLVAPQSGGFYYTLARTPSGGNANDAGFVQWFDEPETMGMKTQRTFDYTLGAYGDYFLIFGLQGGGRLAIDDITVQLLH